MYQQEFSSVYRRGRGQGAARGFGCRSWNTGRGNNEYGSYRDSRGRPPSRSQYRGQRAGHRGGRRGELRGRRWRRASCEPVEWRGEVGEPQSSHMRFQLSPASLPDAEGAAERAQTPRSEAPGPKDEEPQRHEKRPSQDDTPSTEMPNKKKTRSVAGERAAREESTSRNTKKKSTASADSLRRKKKKHVAQTIKILLAEICELKTESAMKTVTLSLNDKALSRKIKEKEGLVDMLLRSSKEDEVSEEILLTEDEDTESPEPSLIYDPETGMVAYEKDVLAVLAKYCPDVDKVIHLYYGMSAMLRPPFRAFLLCLNPLLRQEALREIDQVLPVLTPDQLASMRSVAVEEPTDAALAAWARVEARLKRLGDGALGEMLTHCNSLREEPNRPAKVKRESTNSHSDEHLY